MSAPQVVNVVPGNSETDVFLGSVIIVTFDQEIDVSTVDESTFSLTGPGQTQVLTPDMLASKTPDSLTGREYITGQFAFSQDDQGRTVAQFIPDHPLRHDCTRSLRPPGTTMPSRTRERRRSEITAIAQFSATIPVPGSMIRFLQ